MTHHRTLSLLADRSRTIGAATTGLLFLCACGGDPQLANPSGTLEATEVDIASVLTARLLEVRAAEGERVAAGDTLLVLDTDLLRRQWAQTAARSEVLTAQRAEAEQVLLQSRRRLELAGITLDRVRKLQEQGSATQQNVDELSAEYDVASSQVQGALDRLAGLTAQKSELQATLAVLDRQIADGVVLSPIDGTVLLRASEPGEVARAGSLGLRLANLTHLELRIFLEAPDLDQVRIGQSLPVLVDALEGRELAGTVVWIASEAEFTPKNAQTRKARAQLVYAVKLRVDNPEGVLHIGMPAAVRLSRAQ